LESNIFPLQTLSCGPVLRTAQTQVLPIDDTDQSVLELCARELERRALTESQLQSRYTELLSLRDEALHNKPMLQFFAWRRQRQALHRVKTLFDEVAVLEMNPLPRFTLVVFDNETPTQMGEVLDHFSDEMSTQPSHTLFALVTYPAKTDEESPLTVLRAPDEANGQEHWLVEAGTDREAHIWRKGNALFMDAAGLNTLELQAAQEAAPELWTRCIIMPIREESATWCTEHQWLTLTGTTKRPGRIHQILKTDTSSGEVKSVGWVDTGAMAFWGSGMRHGNQGRIEAAHTGSAPVTLYSFLDGAPVDPLLENWAYPSLLGDLR
jgi:hypothetical protein